MFVMFWSLLLSQALHPPSTVSASAGFAGHYKHLLPNASRWNFEPAQKPDPGASMDRPDKPVRIHRRSPGRKRPGKVEMKPVLWLEWRLMKCNAGEFREVSPVATFHTDDRLALSVKTNQKGFLYIINQTEGDQGEILFGPKLIFPNSRIRGTQDSVEQYQRIILPSGCPSGIQPCDCAWRLDKYAGRETIIIIFSREPVLDLTYNTLTNGTLRRDYVEGLRADFDARRKRGEIKHAQNKTIGPDSAGHYTFSVANYNLNNNEDLIEMISYYHAGDDSTQ
jgi:hypothetical protein